jgi:hypothetical protein
MTTIVVGLPDARYGSFVRKELLVDGMRAALRMLRHGRGAAGTDGATRGSGSLRERVMAALARVAAPMHPTNASGNNRSMR